MALNPLISVEKLSYAWVKSFDFTNLSFISFTPLCDYRSAAPFPKLEALHIA